MFVYRKVTGVEQNHDVGMYSRERIADWLEFMRTRKGDTLVRLLKKQQTHNPSVQGVWTPFTNKQPWLSVEKYPSATLNVPKQTEKTATEKIIELAASQLNHHK